MFPSPEYIKLCTQPEVADRLREEWEPKFGDWVITDTKHLAIVVGRDLFAHDDKGGAVWVLSGKGDTDYLWRKYETNLTPLFQPRQIIEMLEERGYDWRLERITEEDDLAEIWCEAVVFDLKDDGEPSNMFYGPDPETALLRAWLEVVKDE